MKISSKHVLLLSQLLFAGSALSFNAFTVKKIKVNGLNIVSKEAVLQAIDIKPGNKITREDTSEIIKNVFQTGFFKDVSLEKSGNVLIVNVKERPVISEFKLTGIKNNKNVNKILRKYELVQGRMYNPNNITKAKEELELFYLGQGKYGVKIESEIKKVSAKKIDLTLSIYEGDDARVKLVKIVGNESFSEKELLGELYHAKTNIFSWFTKKDRYSKEKLAADLEVLRSYYMDRGYVNFKVESTQVSLSTDKKDLFITINVSEGAKFNFGHIKVDGEFVVPKQEVLEIVKEKISEGDIFSRKLLWEVKQDIEDRFGEEGYSKADVKFNLDPSGGSKINIDFFIKPNKRVYVRQVNFTGNTLTQDQVLRRAVPQQESTWISTKEVKSGKNRIMREGFANKVDVKTEKVAGTEDQVDINYDIEEQKTAQLSAGLAYSQADGIMFNLGANFRNFAGTGKDINFNFDHAKDFQTYSFGYYNPYFTPDGVGFGYNVYYQHTNYSKTTDVFNYANNALGGDVFWSYPISEFDRINFGFGVDRSELVFDTASAPAEVVQFTEREGKKFHELSVNAGWKRNTLDRFIFPTKGLRQTASFKMSTPISDLKYYILSYNINWFKPVYKDYIFSFSGKAAYGNKYGNTFKYPFFKHYFAGGAESVRGFDDRSLGPIDSKGTRHGGNALVQATAELIFPPPLFPDTKSVRTSVFLDAGQVYDTGRLVNISPDNPGGLKFSAGISLKWHSPFGVPMVFSLAKPLNAKENDKRRSFHFTFGAQLF